MKLLTPLALLGLLTLAPILLLHLLRNRRQALPIPSLKLWRGLEQRRRGSRFRTPPLSLLLLLQLALAALLTLGLARPAWPLQQRQPRHTIFILDTTTSMAAQDVSSLVPNSQGTVRRFDAARQVVRAQLEDVRDGDSVLVIGLNPRPEVLLASDAPAKAGALLALRDLTPGATGVDLAAALTLANGLVDDERENQIVVLSDGGYAADPQTLPRMLAPLTWRLFPAPVATGGEPASNQALLNVSARALPDGNQRLFARVVNYGPEQVARTLRVSAGGRVVDERSVQIEAGGEIARVWTLPGQATTATVELVEQDALPLDNRAALSLTDQTRRRVLLVSDTPDTLARALEAQPGVDLTLDSPANVPLVPAGFDLIVFEGLSPDLTTWPRGNLLTVNPPLGHPLLPAQSFARGLRPDPRSASELLAGVDWSGVYLERAPRVALPGWASVDLRAAGELPLIFHGVVGDSRLVVWAFDLDESNLPARLALPLLTSNTLAHLLSFAPRPVVAAGEPVWIGRGREVEAPDGERHLLAASGGQAVLFSHTQQAGLYQVLDENGAPLAAFAVHAGSALESNLAPRLQLDALEALEAPAQTTADSQTVQREIWPWLVGLALVTLTVEGWLAWRR
jgi:hypothetical protein